MVGGVSYEFRNRRSPSLIPTPAANSSSADSVDRLRALLESSQSLGDRRVECKGTPFSFNLAYSSRRDSSARTLRPSIHRYRRPRAVRRSSPTCRRPRRSGDTQRRDPPRPQGCALQPEHRGARSDDCLTAGPAQSPRVPMRQIPTSGLGPRAPTRDSRDTGSAGTGSAWSAPLTTPHQPRFGRLDVPVSQIEPAEHVQADPPHHFVIHGDRQFDTALQILSWHRAFRCTS